MSTPLVIVSDSPNGPTGLGRIARDLGQRLGEMPELDVHMIGWEAGPSWGGGPRYTGHQDVEHWGGRTLSQWWPEHMDRRAWGIVLSIWDPARCVGLREADAPNAQWWGYFPIDANNIRGAISGPPANVLGKYDRVLAYGRYGQEVLGQVRPDVQHLPHGIDPTVWYSQRGMQSAWDAVGDILAPVVTPRSTLIGCVATNQPRKDLGLLCHTIALLREQDKSIKLWLHVDQQITAAWSVPQLLMDFGLSRHTVISYDLQDWQLAACYSYCACTIAPGLGEGFGYPIVESLACGVPCVHGTYGGGAELIPCPDWAFPVKFTRLEGAYALVRPVYDPVDVCNAVNMALTWTRENPDEVSNYCIGSVSHLFWYRLWPHWERWVRQGLEELG